MDLPQILLEVSQIGRTAHGRWLLNDVSMQIRAGDRWAMVGPTGAGKTLLLRTLSLLDPIDVGSIRWNGQQIVNEAVPQFRRQVIYLHQKPVLLDGNVESNLQRPFTFEDSRPLQNQKPVRFDRGYILRLLSELDRDAAFLVKSSSELSGGEAQIVALLRAIQLGPSILLLDEPTAALDAESTKAIETLVENWLREPGQQRATVWVGHDADQIARVADKTLILNDGQVHKETSKKR